MRILLPGGSGQVGTLLARHLHARGHVVTVLSRNPSAHAGRPWRVLPWDGRTEPPTSDASSWIREIDRSDAVIHLSGRSVNCRYTPANRQAIVDSRVEPTLLLGRAIAESLTPPKLWLNASTSTFYRHAGPENGFAPNDEFTGILGDLPTQRGTNEPASLPETWSFSIDVARRWEEAFAAIPTPCTKKIALRSSMVMSPDAGGVFRVLSSLVRRGLGGAAGPGTQFVSWIHDLDLCRAIDLLLAQPEIADETHGIVNLTSPEPVPNRDFMRTLREAWGVGFGLPATRWMLEIGALLMQTETELLLKSRRVTPGVLLRHGFDFQFPDWTSAANNLVARTRREAH